MLKSSFSKVAAPAYVKFCGLSRMADIRHACASGAHAIGFVFVPNSKRMLSLAQAVALRDAVPPLVNLVAVFMNQTARLVKQVIKQVRVNSLQFHGEESNTFCAQFTIPFIKSIPLGSIGWQDIPPYMRRYPSARGFIIDSNAIGTMGGSGIAIQWKKIPAALRSKIILSGGITSENAHRARMQTGLYQFDCSSGIEYASGKKSPQKIKQVMATLST